MDLGSILPYQVKLESDGFRPSVWCFEVKHIHDRKKYPVIVITSDGTTTTATMHEGKKVIKTATAKCSAKDTFDFSEGARVAFERLQGRDPFEKNPFYTGKVVCIRCTVPHFWTVGKVYEIKDGIVKDNCGTTLKHIRNVDEMNRELMKFAQFIPIVGD